MDGRISVATSEATLKIREKYDKSIIMIIIRIIRPAIHNKPRSRRSRRFCDDEDNCNKQSRPLKAYNTLYTWEIIIEKCVTKNVLYVEWDNGYKLTSSALTPFCGPSIVCCVQQCCLRSATVLKML